MVKIPDKNLVLRETRLSRSWDVIQQFLPNQKKEIKFDCPIKSKTFDLFSIQKSSLFKQDYFFKVTPFITK